jgi:predicted dehydrogenase
MKKLKVGIAGFGIVGKRRMKYINRNKHLKTVAVSDSTFKGDGVFNNGLLYFNDYKKIFSIELDILFVCLPNRYAPLATIKGLKNNLHVFCEKPPGRNVKDIENVIKAEKENKHLKLKYGFNHRYHKSIIEAKKIIESGTFGEIINFRGVYGKSKIIPFSGEWRSKRKEAGGGILLDQGIHMLDMILYFSNEFDKVYSFVSNNFWNHDVEDNAYIMMKDRKGRVAMLHSTATEWRHKFRLEITLEKAQLELSGILSGSKSYGEEKLIITKRNIGNMSTKLIEKCKKYTLDESWKNEVNEFAKNIVNNKPIISGNSKDALSVMKLIYMIYKSDKSWKKKFNL